MRLRKPAFRLYGLLNYFTNVCAVCKSQYWQVSSLLLKELLERALDKLLAGARAWKNFAPPANLTWPKSRGNFIILPAESECLEHHLKITPRRDIKSPARANTISCNANTQNLFRIAEKVVFSSKECSVRTIDFCIIPIRLISNRAPTKRRLIRNSSPLRSFVLFRYARSFFPVSQRAGGPE